MKIQKFIHQQHKNEKSNMNNSPQTGSTIHQDPTIRRTSLQHNPPQFYTLHQDPNITNIFTSITSMDQLIRKKLRINTYRERQKCILWFASNTRGKIHHIHKDMFTPFREESIAPQTSKRWLLENIIHDSDGLSSYGTMHIITYRV